MELQDFVGKHILTGVDEFVESVESYGINEDAQFIAFELDGKVYVAQEDPGDGYRSYMKTIEEKNLSLKNRFAKNEVLGKMREDGKYEVNNIIDFVDTKTGKTVLSIGTANTDDYYPYFVGEFNPENMALNAPAENKEHQAIG